MEENSRMGPMQGTFYAAMLFVGIRILCNMTLLRLPTPFGEIVYCLGFCTAMFLVTRRLGEKTGLSLGDMHILPFRMTWYAPIIALVSAFLIRVLFILLLPGEFTAGALSPAENVAFISDRVFKSGLCSGISEEIIFRGYMLSVIAREYGRAKATIITTLIFVLGHFDGRSLDALLGVGIMGLLLALLTLKSGSIWPAAFVHFFNNTFNRFVHIGISTDDSPALMHYIVPQSQVEQIYTLNRVAPYIQFAVFGGMIFVLLISLRRDARLSGAGGVADVEVADKT